MRETLASPHLSSLSFRALQRSGWRRIGRSQTAGSYANEPSSAAPAAPLLSRASAQHACRARQVRGRRCFDARRGTWPADHGSASLLASRAPHRLDAAVVCDRSLESAQGRCATPATSMRGVTRTQVWLDLSSAESPACCCSKGKGRSSETAAGRSEHHSCCYRASFCFPIGYPQRKLREARSCGSRLERSEDGGYFTRTEGRTAVLHPASALAEDLGLRCRELFFGENALLFQFGELGEAIDGIRSLLCLRLG